MGFDRGAASTMRWMHSQEWVVRSLEHRIGDKRILRLIQKWLRAGVLEDEVVTIEEGRDRAR